MLSSLPLVKPIRLTKLEQSQFSLSEDLKSILVGLLLGDLCAQKRTIKGNTCLHFEQGLVHKDYIYHLYELFEPYCRSVPKITNRLPDKRTGKIYSRVQFNTYSLPCFNEFYNLFLICFAFSDNFVVRKCRTNSPRGICVPLLDIPVGMTRREYILKQNNSKKYVGFNDTLVFSLPDL